MNRRAFTLMEMVIVMAIIALVFTASFAGMKTLSKQQELQEPFDELRSLAKTAWQRAMTEQRAWQIRFYPGHFVLEPKQAVNEDDQKLFNDADAQMGRGSGVVTVTVPDTIMMEVRRWGQGKWIEPGKERELQPVWVFEHSGLCEPISVRFTNDRNATVGAQFDPLTASVKEDITDREGL